MLFIAYRNGFIMHIIHAEINRAEKGADSDATQQ